MLTFKNEQLRDKIKAETPAAAEQADQTDFLPIAHLEDSVRDDVNFLKESPLVLEDTVITGWVYDVNTGKVNGHVPLKHAHSN